MIIGWVQRSLVRAGAALRCEHHGNLRSTGDDAAARSAVIVGQLARFDDLSANAIELILLETYLSLSNECPDCVGSSQLTYVSRDQRIPKR
jgi:hypothetical protein